MLQGPAQVRFTLLGDTEWVWVGRVAVCCGVWSCQGGFVQTLVGRRSRPTGERAPLASLMRPRGLRGVGEAGTDKGRLSPQPWAQWMGSGRFYVRRIGLRADRLLSAWQGNLLRALVCLSVGLTQIRSANSDHNPPRGVGVFVDLPHRPSATCPLRPKRKVANDGSRIVKL